jgi:MoaA/NifB/PqqE/SkfB family radical SAM enzyme
LILGDKLVEYVRYAKNKGLKDVVFNSNGQLLTEDLSRKLLEAGLDGIYVGMDAFSEAVYDKLRVGGKFDRVVGNVNSFIELEKKMNVSPERMYVQFVEMPENRHEMAAFSDYWTDRGAIVKIRPMVSWAGRIRAANLDPQKERFPCYWIMQNISITSTGDVSLCAVDMERAFHGGSVKERSIEDVWRNGPLSEIRRMHLEREWERLPFLCRECLDWQSAGAVFKEKKQ